MSDAKHSPEPWRWIPDPEEFGTWRTVSCWLAGLPNVIDGVDIGSRRILYCSESGGFGPSKEDAKRIVACVNACKDIDTSVLMNPNVSLTPIVHGLRKKLWVILEELLP